MPQHCLDCGVGRLTGKVAQASSRGGGQLTLARKRQLGQHRQGRGIAQVRKVLDSSHTDRGGAFGGHRQERGTGGGVASIPQGVDHQQLPVNMQLWQFLGERRGDFRTGQFHGSPHGRLGLDAIRSANGLQHERNAPLATDDDRPAEGCGTDVPRGLRQPHQVVVNGLCLGGLPLGRQLFGATEEPFAQRVMVGAGCGRQGGLKGLGGLEAADIAQSPGGCLGGCSIRFRQQFGKQGNGLGVAADTETADHPQPKSALESSQGRAEGGVHGRIANRLQGITGHVRQLLVAQQLGQRGDGLFSADAGELATGRDLFILARVGLEHADQLRLLLGDRGRGGGKQDDE